MHVQNSSLGKSSAYIAKYKPELLFPILRANTRRELGLNLDNLAFQGDDIWNAYELSWLNGKGKPEVAIAEFRFSCTSPNLIESKSFKLYLNSFNNTVFNSHEEVSQALKQDLSKVTGALVKVNLKKLDEIEKIMTHFSGTCLDDLDVVCTDYLPESKTLLTSNVPVHEVLYSDLLKSNCPVTGQPDWASIQIEYVGNKINHAGLLQYIVSFRNHNGFHEDCVERIFTDIMRLCKPVKLFVYARYTRRGGLDINPYRANFDVNPSQMRLCRQ